MANAKHPSLYLWKRDQAPIVEEDGWVGPRASLDECPEKTATCPHRDSGPQPSSPLRVAISASFALNSGCFEGRYSTALVFKS